MESFGRDMLKNIAWKSSDSLTKRCLKQYFSHKVQSIAYTNLSQISIPLVLRTS